MTDKQQPPERIWISPRQAEMYAKDERLRDPSDTELYARVRPVDDARVEEIGRWVDRHTMQNSNAYADLSRAFGEIRYLLSLLPHLSSSEPRLKDGGAAGSILRPLCDEHPHVKFVEGVLGGVQPLIEGHRVGVSHLLGRMAIGMGIAEYQETWKFDDETIKDVFAYAQDVIDALIGRERATAPAESSEHRCGVSVTGRHRIDYPYCKDCGLVLPLPPEYAFPATGAANRDAAIATLRELRADDPAEVARQKESWHTLKQDLGATSAEKCPRCGWANDGIITCEHAAAGADKGESPWVDANGHVWERRSGVECVECPDCCFTFAAIHGDSTGGYSCPNCERCPDGG